MKATEGTTNGRGRSTTTESRSSDFRLTPSNCPITLEELEKQHIQATIAWAGGNKTRAAAVLGIDRRTLFRKLAKYKGKV